MSLDMDDLPEGLWPGVAGALQNVLSCGPDGYEIMAASAGYLYERKGYLTVDLFGKPRNGRGTVADDMVLTLTVRLCPGSYAGVSTLKAAALAEERARLAAELARAEADRDTAQSRVDELRRLVEDV